VGFVQGRGRRFLQAGGGNFLRREGRIRCLRKIGKRFVQFPGGFVRFFFPERQVHIRNLTGRDRVPAGSISAGWDLSGQFGRGGGLRRFSGHADRVFNSGSGAFLRRLLPGRGRCGTGKKHPTQQKQEDR
jgi:hypothetical protein